eukprot:Gregarina_sp_Poly_1__9706@NODE_616_length_7127_cov_52_867989_g472_i0_p8_GENE_NODE_616_length_7127_cov_52_867989_g472_i0NODE_616_length_7127_cov_52_867989_g472_i0_p8_ORF_typecomplete_len124_score4_10_NODE_616_length_7127_cov_52_867989_g472_i052215592
MARQAGSYLGAVFNQQRRLREYNPLPWAPRTYGAMSYVGGNKAIVELTRKWNVPRPEVVRFMGSRANWLWRLYYWSSQTSKYNQIMSLMDYAKQWLTGREIVEQSLASTASRNSQRNRNDKRD